MRILGLAVLSKSNVSLISFFVSFSTSLIIEVENEAKKPMDRETELLIFIDLFINRIPSHSLVNTLVRV